MPWTTFSTAIGTCGIAWTDAGITHFQLPEATDARTVARLRSRAKDEPAGKKRPQAVAKTIALVQRHLAGEPQDLSAIPLDLEHVPAFPAKIYRALQDVPPGRTTTYGELAAQAGAAGSARAVGRAMATNPIPLIVPCHRVLAAAGKPGGFSAFGGAVTKEKLLALEGASERARTEPLFAATRAARTNELGPAAVKRALAKLAEADSVLGKHIATIPFALTVKDTESTFAALAEAIVYQQLSGKAAATIFGRVTSLFPRGHLDARLLVKMADEPLRTAGLSRGKLAALRDLSSRVVAGEIPTIGQLEQMDDAAIIEKLTEVRGIGRWTVEMLLIFRLARPDVFPTADYGIKKGFARLFHPPKRRAELPEDDAMRRRAERWRPHRSIASWYLWRAAELS